MIITLKMLKTFKIHDGDVDSLARASGLKTSHDGMDDSHIFLISEMIQDLLLIRRKLVSKEYETGAMARIQASCENNEVVEVLRQMATSMESKDKIN